ncbi:MAG: GyrI-like domain-containing protein [Bacteroidia bacterium]|nr:GyrI-like domain-containing protein [Bacteroidia bacterium]
MQTVKIEPFHMLGISIITSNKDGQALKEIGDLWGRFISENISGQIPNKVDDTVYSLYTDYEGDHTKPYRVILGCKVSSLEDVPEGMLGRTFDGGNYAQFTAKGNLNEGLVGKKWFEIWQMDLNRAYTADFEVFGEKALNPTDAEVDFLIAIN